MKKKVFGRKLSRATSTRRALYRSIIRALVLYGSISTTKAKAKAIQPEVEKIINLAKENSVAGKRRVYAILGNDRKTASRIFEAITPLFMEVKSGFTRIINLPQRRGDNSKVVRFEWTKKIEVEDKKKKEEKKDVKEVKKPKKESLFQKIKSKK